MKKKKEREQFLIKLDYLFNIASCTHNIISCQEALCKGCDVEGHLESCNCTKQKKIPKLELRFMKSMREHRPPGLKATMMMGGDDKVESTKQNTALARKAAEEEIRILKEVNNNDREKDLEERRRTEAEHEEEEKPKGGRQVEDTSGENQKKKGSRNTLKLTQTALAAIRS